MKELIVSYRKISQLLKLDLPNGYLNLMHNLLISHLQFQQYLNVFICGQPHTIGD